MQCDGQYFRAGVGAVIVNDQSEVLAFERSDVPGAWQLPQGGIEAGEEPTEAIGREILEETGLSISDLTFLGRYPDLLVYELPLDARSKKTGRGQVQYWFVFRADVERKLTIELNEEFNTWRWMPMLELIRCTADFRRSLYEKLLAFLPTVAKD